MLNKHSSYADLYANFEWQIPEKFNIGEACCDIHADVSPELPALIRWNREAKRDVLNFGELRDQSNQLANALTALGAGWGDRIGIILPQCFETALCHIAVFKMGAISVPLARLFAADALKYRLHRSGVSTVITNSSGLEKIQSIRGELPHLKHIICVDECSGETDVHYFQTLIAKYETFYSIAETKPDTPALIIFTSGTTGPAKGALHGHRVLLGHIPGIQFHHDFIPHTDDIGWTPADWAWAGGLLNMLLPCLYFGKPVVFGSNDRFDPETSLKLLEETHVTMAFIPPTALKLFRSVPTIKERYQLKLRTIGSAGESLGADTLNWVKENIGIVVSEFYGQTECNLILSSSASLNVVRGGSTGKPVPGHIVSILDEDGCEVESGDHGQIAIKGPDPVMFLGYWDDEASTDEKFIGNWLITGDQAFVDEDGYFHFIGRDDDIINSAGYRVGPSEIEDCLISHEAVLQAVAVGKPDKLRSEIIKSYLVLKPGYEISETLANEIRQHVKNKMAANIYPREIEFVDSVPMTTTGKVIRRTFRQQAKLEAGLD